MADLNETLLTDIAFTDDFKASPTGDLDVVSGMRNLQGALLRRLLTTPGSLVHRPAYGCGLAEFQNASMTLGTKRQLSLRIANQFPLDPRVDSVESVNIQTNDNEPDTMTITVKCKIVGVGSQEIVFTPFDGTV